MATSSACNITNGGPVVIENPEMLKKDKTSATNGHDISRSSSNNSLAKSKLYPQVKNTSVSRKKINLKKKFKINYLLTYVYTLEPYGQTNRG